MRTAPRGVLLRRPLTALIALALVAVGAVAPTAQADVVTYGVDNLRTSWDSDETRLSPSAVSSFSFGKLFATTVQGQVYAQPVVAGGRVIAATEDNQAYGLDPVTGAVAWTADLGTPWPASTSRRPRRPAGTVRPPASGVVVVKTPAGAFALVMVMAMLPVLVTAKVCVEDRPTGTSPKSSVAGSSIRGAPVTAVPPRGTVTPPASLTTRSSAAAAPGAKGR